MLSNMMRAKFWLPIILANFLIAAIYGALMRLAFVYELNWIDYRNVMHGHSHVAMLGWLYLGLFILFTHTFIPEKLQSRRFQFVFLLTQVTVIGMAVAFPLQGYGGFSIAFSTLHVFLSYYFIFIFLKSIARTELKGSKSVLMAKTSMVFMVLSTLALFTMAPIMVLDMRSSNLYYMAVQFFLHFQFNGWFIFGILAVFFRLLEKENISISNKTFKSFYLCLVISCILTYALAVTWSNPSPILFFTNSAGVLIQLIALYFFIRILMDCYPIFRKSISRRIHWLYVVGFIGLTIKIIVQFAVVIPYLGKIAYTIRNYVIGFIHLILLGSITFLLFAVAAQLKLLNIHSKGIQNGLTILFAGVLLSELLLFLQGTFLWIGFGFIPFYYEIIFAVSLLMPLGVALLFINTRTAASFESPTKHRLINL